MTRTTRSQRIRMDSLTALTFRSGALTTGRRTAPIPQLNCLGSRALCAKYQPPVIQCTPVGSDGDGGLEWKCEADLVNGVGLGEVEVGCEGWGTLRLFIQCCYLMTDVRLEDGPSDPYILKGSCALNYNLVRTPSSSFESSSSYLPSYKSSSSYGKVSVFFAPRAAD
jgi:hypothetical protein